MSAWTTLSDRVAVIAGLLATVGLYAAAFSAETGVGTLRGRVTVEGTGAPLAGIAVVATPKVPQDGNDTFSDRTDAQGAFDFSRLPAGQYDVRPTTTVYQNTTHPVTVVEGQPAALDLALKPNDPFLNLYVHQRNYIPGEDPKVSVNGFRQGEQLQMTLLTVDTDALVRQHGGDLRALLNPVSASGKPGTLAALKNGKLRRVRNWSYTVRKRDAEGVFYEDLRLGKLPPALYLVSARGEKTEGLGWLLVTDLALVTKYARGRMVAMTADLRTGKPVPGVEVTFYKDQKVRAKAVTSATGMAELRVNVQGDGEQFDGLARRGASLALLRFFGSSERGQRYRLFAHTDRPVYRPGHRVQYRGVVRMPEGVGYAVPSERPVLVEVRDYQDTLIDEREVPMDARGVFAGQLDLPPTASSGYYTLKIKIDEELHEEYGFSVASYRKPEWKVEVKPGKPHYIRGEKVPVTVDATYYFGSPVVGGKVSYTVYRSEHWRWWGDEESDAEYEYDEEGGASGEVVADGETTTDDGGSARFEFPTAVPKEVDAATEFEYSIEVNVSDQSDRSAAGNGKVLVSPAEISLDARASAYVSPPGKQQTVLARVRDLDGKPLAGVAVEAAAVEQQYVNGKTVEHPLQSQTLQTDAQGEISFPVTPRTPGMLLVKLGARDARGNRVETTADIWVSTTEGGDYLRSYPNLAVLPDRKVYHRGDTAQILVNTSRPGATAIVAVEAEGILDYKVVPLQTKSTVVRFPIRSGYEPNVFVTACFVQGKEFYQEEARLNVDATEHRLRVTIRSDRETYRPGDTATYQVRIADPHGRPVAADFSLGVVDEAIYAIREEPKQGIWEAFYPRRRNEVRTEYSFPQIYLGDADKDGASDTVRRNFADTAYWNPRLRTDATGIASVSVRLPDNLTSWRATVVAESAATQVGRTTRNVKVTRDLVVRLQTPRTLTEGDRLQLSAVAHNYTASPLRVAVDLKAQGLTVEGGAQTVKIEPGGAEKVLWNVRATTPGTASITAVASAGALTDGMELKVPVRAFAKEQVLYKTGALTEASAAEEFTVDPGAVAGGAEIRLSPSLAGAILGSLEYLATYPHGCVEQTMSSFMPDLVAHRTLKELGVSRPELQQKLPAMVQAGLLRLYHYQHEDYGWGWWEYDETDPWMTGYVLFGLQEAQQAGYPINEQIAANGLGRAKELVADTKVPRDTGLFLAYVLARAKERAAALARLKRVSDADLQAAGTVPKKGLAGMHLRSLGYAALAYAALGDSDSRRRAEEIMQVAWSKAATNAGLPRWEEKRDFSYAYGVPQDVETTAVLLRAALAITPEDERIPGVVRWLLTRRNGDRWMSTRDTAWILLALTDYLKRSGELKPDYHLTVTLNGKTIHEDVVKPGDALQEETVLKIPLKDLTPADRLEIRKEGKGTVYYALSVRQQVRAASFPAESGVPGLTVKREYFRLETKRDAQGRIVIAPEGRAVSRVKVGDRLMVRLTVHTDRRLEYLMLEDPLPAGLEVQDRGELSRDEWSYWWSHMDIRDDRVNLFIRDLPPGNHVLEYYARPEMAGATQALPAVLSDMYVPSTRASTPEARLEVTR